MEQSICSWCHKYVLSTQLRDHQFECELSLSEGPISLRKSIPAKKKARDSGDRLDGILNSMSSDANRYSTANTCKRCGQVFQNLQMLSKHTPYCIIQSYKRVVCSKCGKNHGDKPCRDINTAISNTLEEISKTDGDKKYQKCTVCGALLPIATASRHIEECFNEIVYNTNQRNLNEDQITVISDDEQPLTNKRMRTEHRDEKRLCLFCKTYIDPNIFRKHAIKCEMINQAEILYKKQTCENKNIPYMIADCERRMCVICLKSFMSEESKITHDSECVEAFKMANKELFNQFEYEPVTDTLRHILKLVQKVPFYCHDGIRIDAKSVMSSIFKLDVRGYHADEKRISVLCKALQEMRDKNARDLSVMLDKAVENQDIFLSCAIVDAISRVIMETKIKLDYIYVLNKTRTLRNNVLNALWYNTENKTSGDPYIIFNLLELCLIEKNMFLFYQVIMKSKLFSFEDIAASLELLGREYKYLYRLVSFSDGISTKYTAK